MVCFHCFQYISLYASRVGVAIASAFVILIIVFMIIRGRNVNGVPNTIRGEVGKVSGLPNDVDPYVVVSSMGEMAHRTTYRPRPGDTAVFEESFAWAVSPNAAYKFRTAGKIRFEVFNMKGAGYSVADGSLGAVEIPISELYTEGQIERVEALRLRTKKGVVINVKVGVFAEHSFYQSMNRFGQMWRLRQREVSFWARLFSIGLAVMLIFLGLEYFHEKDHRSLGLCDLVVGSVIGATLVPHVFHWAGITLLDMLRMESLLSAWSLYISSASTMGVMSHYFGPVDPLDTLGHFLLIGATGLVAIMFLIGDFRGEPGSSCLGRSLGAVFGTACSCCFGSTRASMLRAAV